jgi:hypothetical protein
MFELIERTGESRIAPARYATLREAADALAKRADELRGGSGVMTVTEVLPRFVVALHEQGITVTCLRRCA